MGPTVQVIEDPNVLILVDPLNAPVFLTFPNGSDGDVIEVKAISTGVFLGTNVSITTTGTDFIENPALPGTAIGTLTQASFVGGILNEAYKWEFTDKIGISGTWIVTADYEPPESTPVQQLSQVISFVVAPGETVNQDQAVSILPNGQAIAGYTFKGQTNIDETFSSFLTTKLTDDLVVRVSFAGQAQVLQNQAPNDRPIFGDLFDIPSIGNNGVNYVHTIDSTRFVVVSQDDTDDRTIYLVMVEVGPAPTYSMTAGTPFSIAGVNGNLDMRAQIVVFSPTEMALIYKQGGTLTPGQPDMLRLTYSTLFLTITSILATTQLNVFNPAFASANTLANIYSLPLTTTDMLFMLVVGSQTRMVVVTWDSGSGTFIPGPVLALTPWTLATTETYGDTDDQLLPSPMVIYNNVVLITSTAGEYRTILVSGNTLTEQTTGTIYSIPGVESEGGSLSNLGQYVILSNSNYAIHGEISDVAPYAVTWGTPLKIFGAGMSISNYLEASRTLLFNRGNNEVQSLTVDSASDTLDYYQFEGEVPVGLALQTVVGDGTATVDVTIFGTHIMGSATLMPGSPYYSYPDGSVGLSTYITGVIPQAQLRYNIGIAVTTDRLEIIHGPFVVEI